MKIIIEGTGEEISDLLYLQSQNNYAEKVRSFEKIKSNRVVDKQDILTLAISMEALFEPFSRNLPEYEDLKTLVAKLKETL